MGLASQSVKVPVWAKVDADKALEMFNAGASYGTLEVHFQKSRGSIAGLINRFRVKGLAVRSIERVKVHKARRPRRPDPIAVAIIAKPPQVAPKRIRLRMIENDTEVTFAELQPYHCKYPFGDPKQSDFRFCGKMKCDDLPYCKDHCALVYAPKPVRRR